MKVFGFFIVSVVLFFAGCVSAPQKMASKPKVEDLPMCSRIKFWIAEEQGKTVDAKDPAFQREAAQDAKRISEAATLMNKDVAGTKKICRALSVQDLLIKPKHCSNKWNGPYLEEGLSQDYSSLNSENFEDFTNCWK